MRILFWNTWLLRPGIWPDGPALPGSRWLFAPAVAQRAERIGKVLAGRFDVCALAECFGPANAERVLAAWAARSPTVAHGPQRGRFPRLIDSGLLTIVDGIKLRGFDHHTFQAGRDLRDPDTFAAKGVLLVRLDLGSGGPALDLFSTHLISGGIQWRRRGVDSARVRRDRAAQIDELITFIKARHDPAHAMLLVGDFNIPAHQPDGLSHGREYAILSAKLAPLGLRDLWATQGVGPGPTRLFAYQTHLPHDPEQPDRTRDCEETADAGRRIDQLWLAQPAIESKAGYTIVAGRPRRWGFTDPLESGRQSRFLSDHLALSVDLTVRPDGRQ